VLVVVVVVVAPPPPRLTRRGPAGTTSTILRVPGSRITISSSTTKNE
jgi:hypothetical protein